MRSVRSAGFAVVLLGSAALATLGAAPLAGAQPGPPAPFTCNASASSPSLPAESETVLVSDIVLTCTGGNPTPTKQIVPQANITIALNTTTTSRLIAAPVSGLTLTEATLLVDDPAPAAQSPCVATTQGLPYVCQVTGTG